MMQLPMVYRLTCLTKRDENCKVHVGYIPVLRVYTQATTEERLTAALKSAATMFITSCFERGVLDEVLHARGMSKAIPGETHGKIAADQFIAVANFDKEIEMDVPITLLAREAQIACQ